MRVWSRQEFIVLNYAADGDVRIQALPLTRQAQEAQQLGYARNTIDPASRAMKVIPIA
jgi:hypothetical protein